MKKLVTGLLSVAMMTSLLAGCGSSTEKAEDNSQKLTVWVEKYFSDTANELTEQRIEAFAEKTGMDVSYEFIPAVDYMTKLNAAIESGNLPDVTVGGLHKVLGYYPENPYLDITDLVQEIDSQRPYLESMIEGTKIEGKNYFAPYNCSSAILFARKDIFEAKGVEYPTTWEELVDAAIAITDPENGVYGFAMGCGPTDEDAENVFNMMMWDNGGSLLDENEQVRTEVDPATLEAVNWVKELYDAEAVPPGGTTWDPSGNNKSYLVGESAMVINAPTLWNALQSDESYKELFENTVVLSAPVGKAADTVLGFQYGWSIMKDAKNIDGAKEFVRFMFEKDWYDEYITTVTPVFAPVFEDCAEMDLWKDGGINEKVMEYNMKADGYYGYPAVSTEARAVIAKHYFGFPLSNMLNTVVTGKATAEEAILDMYEGISDIWDNMK